VSTTTSDTDIANSQPSSARRRWWLGLLVAAGLAVAAYRMLGDSGRQAASAAPTAAPANRGVPVVAAAVRSGDMPVVQTALGSVTAFNTVTVRSRVDGELIKVAFQEGQFVHEGDLLAEIDPRPFQVQLTQAQGQLARDTAQLRDAEINLERYRGLVAKGLIAKQQFDDQAALVGQYQGGVTADQGLIDNAKLQLTYARVTAPISGRVGLRLVDAGNVVHANDQNGLVVITQVQPIAVLFTVPEDDLPPILAKMRGHEPLTVDVYDRAGQTKIAAGTLLTIDNQIDPATGTTRLKAVVPNEGNELFPNQFVNVRLLIDVRKDSVIAPLAAVQRGPQGTFVYVVKSDQSVEVRPVTVGPNAGGNTAFESGVTPGEVVVVDGVDKLRAGSPVQVKMTDAATPSAPPHV
jgi:multidrug efflux system membrane fusion protein